MIANEPSEAVETFVDQVWSELGHVDAIVNCAGPYHRAKLLTETVDGWQSMFRNNLDPVFLLDQSATDSSRSEH